MSFSVRFNEKARADLFRLYDHILERTDGDWLLADRALDAIKASVRLLEFTPFGHRKVDAQNPFLREMVVGFGAAGYVVLYEVETTYLVTMLAIRHQREDDYFY